MTLRHLQIFITVCDSASVTIAAGRLFMAQSAVSLAIGELEKHYGVRLFDRISRRLQITDAGKHFLDYARHIIDSFVELEKSMASWEQWGQLRIGSSITIGTNLLPQLVKNFSDQYPQIKVNVVIDQSAIIERRILNNELDIAMIEGVVHSGKIIAQSFMDDELVLICGEGSELRAAGRISTARLSEQTFILREKGSGTRERFDSVMLTHGLHIVPAWESISTSAIINAVQAGLGVSVLPCRLVEKDLRQGRLSALEIENVDFKRVFNLIYHQDKFINNSMNMFREQVMSLAPERDYSYYAR